MKKFILKFMARFIITSQMLILPTLALADVTNILADIQKSAKGYSGTFSCPANDANNMVTLNNPDGHESSSAIANCPSGVQVVINDSNNNEYTTCQFNVPNGGSVRVTTDGSGVIVGQCCKNPDGPCQHGCTIVSSGEHCDW